MKYPQTVEDAVSRLKKEISQEDLQWIKKIKKDKLIMLHHSLGRCIRNEYGLWGKNEALLRSCNGGFKSDHPDDASFVIIEKLWDDLQK